MAQGFLMGLIWGSLISVGGAAVVSLNTGLPQPPDLMTTAPEPVAASDQTDETAPIAGQTSESGQVVATLQAPTQPEAPVEPESQDIAALQTEDPESSDTPVIGTVQPLPDTASGSETAPQVSVVTDDSTRTSVPVAPSEAEGADAPEIATAPAQPTPAPAPAPDPEAEAVPVAEDVVVAQNEVVDAEPDTPADQSAATEAEVAQTPDDDAPLSDSEAAETTVAEAPSVVPTPAADPEDLAEADPAATVEPDQAAAPPVETAQVAEETTQSAPAPRVAALPRIGGAETAQDDDASGGVTIGQRVVPLPERNTGASTLPSVAARPAPEDAEAPAPDTAGALSRPIDRFAAPFLNPDDKPLMGIVLIDDEGAFGAEALASFPYALSFAIDPLDPQAADKMRRYREAGFEVLALVDIPEQGTAQDAETVLEVGLSLLSESVGVLEGTSTGIQGNRAVSDQVTAVLRDQGYGLVTQNSGLNTVQKLAAREGVPSAFVFRDIDSEGQTPTVMRRFLDQAAFRASQDGGVIMLGRVRPDTISALLLWGLQDRASRVALAPVTAVLQGTAAQ